MTSKVFDGEDAEENNSDGPELHARTTTQEDGTVECTIYPADADDDERTTHWITAEEGTYVERCRMR